MISYMISSVMDRSTNRSSSIPSYREKSRGSPNRTYGRAYRPNTRPGGAMTLVLTTAMGMTGTFAANAIRATPVRPRYRQPSWDRVPSG